MMVLSTHAIYCNILLQTEKPYQLNLPILRVTSIKEPVYNAGYCVELLMGTCNISWDQSPENKVLYPGMGFLISVI